MPRWADRCEALKVNLVEVEESLRTPESVDGDCLKIARMARHQNGEKLFMIFEKEQDEIHISSKARWECQVTGLEEIERRCSELSEEMDTLRENQKI